MKLLDSGKRCGRCGEFKSWSEFSSNKGRTDGHQGHCKECQWKTDLKYSYNITSDQYFDMLKEQSGVCAICKSEAFSKRFVVDHDHSCCPGRRSCGLCVRGLLCRNCNTAIGMMREDPNIFMSAIKYLEQ